MNIKHLIKQYKLLLLAILAVILIVWGVILLGQTQVNVGFRPYPIF